MNWSAPAPDEVPPNAPPAALAVEADTRAFTSTELDLPESTPGILIAVAGLAALLTITIRTSLRDTRFLSRTARTLLLVPRLLVLALLLIVLLNPRTRTQLSRVEKSRVGIVIDTSLSMQWPATDPAPANSVSGNAPTRRTAVSGTPELASATGESRSDAIIRKLLVSPVLEELSRDHSVSVYTFDSTLTGPWAIISEGTVRFVSPEAGADAADATTASTAPAAGSTPVAAVTLGNQASTATPVPLNDPQLAQRWQQVLQPRGVETRMGESVYQLVGQLAGRTLSGVVVVSDGRSNAGLDTEPARLRAERSGTRLLSVGVGSLRPQLNLRLAGMQSPEDVHQGDPFDLQVAVQGSAAVGQSAVVKLFQQTAGSNGSDRRQVAEETASIPEDGLPTSIRFTQTLSVPGRYDFIARVESASGTAEITLTDNERRRTIEVTDRKMQVLIISSGPMRDYQFVRNTLFRHSGVTSDVWLQSVTEENSGMVSQEARRLLTKFPATEAELFEYDVIVAFDPDWSQLSAEQQSFLNRWVSEHSGGLVVVAGEIFTPRLAENPDATRDVSVLYPVLLARVAPGLQSPQRADEAWPVVPTAEGRVAEFLKIADEQGNADIELWQKFRGIYRTFPIRDLRDGAVVLLEHSNPRARMELGFPPFLVSQFYGSGRCLFLGSAETWRLRAISPQGHQRFWTSLIREAGQSRRSRGSVRGQLLLDRSEAAPGQAVAIRAQLYNASLQPLTVEDVPLTITDPDGQSLAVPDRLTAGTRQPGQFQTSFRPRKPGLHRIAVPIPESSDVLTTTLEVIVPGLESENPVQDTETLTRLTRETQGRYLSLSEIGVLPTLLPNQSQPVIVDEQLRTLWDRAPLMYAAILLLAMEWALRRVWRLS
ncbi:MAG: hypothetical protein ACKOEO_00860 [Planctomycetaceae bacterium]